METIATPRTDIYTPQWCKTLDQIGESQTRLGIQGPAFSGKTTGALTWPNPAALTYDKKLTAHMHRTDVILIPMYEAAFVDKYAKRGLEEPVNRKDALLKWLLTEGVKLKPNQTLIVDGCSGIEESFQAWYRYHETELALTKKGEIDSFVQWNLQKKYFEEVHMALKGLSCSVIFICHETPVFDKDGRDTGKVRPLLAGQSGDKFGANMTDLFKSWAIAKPKTDDEKKRFTDKFAMGDKMLGNEYINSTDSTHETIYLWQTQEDGVTDCGTSSLKGQPKFILPNYNTFCKYRK